MCSNIDIQNKKTIKKNAEESLIPRIKDSFARFHALF